MRRSGTSSAGLALSLRDLGALRPDGAFDLGDAFVDRGQIRRRCRCARRRFDFADRGGQFFRLRALMASSPRSAASDFSSASARAAAAGSGVAAAGLVYPGLHAGDARGKIVDGGGTDLRIDLRRRGWRRRRERPSREPGDAEHQRGGAGTGKRRRRAAAEPRAGAGRGGDGSGSAARRRRAAFAGLAGHLRRLEVDGRRLALGAARIRRRSGIFGPVIDHHDGSSSIAANVTGFDLTS